MNKAEEKSYEAIMTHLVNAKRATGMEEIITAMTPQSPDETRTTRTYPHKMDSIYQAYARGFHFTAFGKQKYVLTPEEINQFLPLTIPHENYIPKNHFDPPYPRKTGYFVSTLIRNSYTAGHNDFILNVSLLQPLDCLLNRMEGTSKNPVRVTIIGNVGECLARGRGTYLHCHIQGDIGRGAGRRLRNSALIVDGDGGEQLGDMAYNSTFQFQSSNIYPGWEAKKCTFRLPRPYPEMRLNQTDRSWQNRAILLHPDGTEEVLFDYREKK